MIDDRNKTVLVTGGAGYIGSHCCKALARAGFEPVVYDNLSGGHREFVKWGPLIEGDVRDGVGLQTAIEQAQPVAVLHFAGLIVVSESVRDPGACWDINLNGTLRLLEAMQRGGVRHLVFSSTAAVYGEPNVDLIDERQPKEPVNPYGASKLAAEKIMEAYDVAHDLRSVRLRYFNAAGADPDVEIGEAHQPETHLIPLVLDAALGRRERISVYGDDYPTEDGTAIRDYIHVCDLAAAHVAALEHLLGGGESAAMNLGTGSGASVAEVIARCRAVTGKAISAKPFPRRAGDPPRLVADPRLAQRLLRWTPERSDLDTIIGDAWAWHKRKFFRPTALPGAQNGLAS